MWELVIIMEIIHVVKCFASNISILFPKNIRLLENLCEISSNRERGGPINKKYFELQMEVFSSFWLLEKYIKV